MSVLITDEEVEAVMAMRQACDRLKELGWDDIARFKPKTDPLGSAPFLGIEAGSFRPIECEYKGRSRDGRDIFTSMDSSDDEAEPERERTVFFMSDSDEAAVKPERGVRLIMFRHYKDDE